MAQCFKSQLMIEHTCHQQMQVCILHGWQIFDLRSAYNQAEPDVIQSETLIGLCSKQKMYSAESHVRSASIWWLDVAENVTGMHP